jgi:hypothetical protein
MPVPPVTAPTSAVWPLEKVNIKCPLTICAPVMPCPDAPDGPTAPAQPPMSRMDINNTETRPGNQREIFKDPPSWKKQIRSVYHARKAVLNDF